VLYGTDKKGDKVDNNGSKNRGIDKKDKKFNNTV
jgi:hypothetical protein